MLSRSLWSTKGAERNSSNISVVLFESRGGEMEKISSSSKPVSQSE
jgi:hypothetical protein